MITNLNIQTEQGKDFMRSAAVDGSREMIVGSLQVTNANMDTLSINTAL